MNTQKSSNLLSSPVVVAGMFTISAAVISPFVAYWLPEKSQKQSPVIIVPQSITSTSSSALPTSASSSELPASPVVPASVGTPASIAPVKNETEEPAQTKANDTTNQHEDELSRLRNLSHLIPLTSANSTINLSEVPLGTYGFAEAPTVDAAGHFNIKAIVLKQSFSGDLNYEYHKKPEEFGMTTNYIVGFTSGPSDITGGLMNMCHLTLYNKPFGNADKAVEVDLGKVQSGEKWQIEKGQDNIRVVSWHIFCSQPLMPR